MFNEASGAELFVECVNTAVERIVASCPDAIAGVDVGIDDVPSASAMWEGLTMHGAVPLAAAIDPQGASPGKVVLFRRPLEHRAMSRADLAELTHHTLVEQLSVLTGRSIKEIDPDFDDRW
jgi:predicted Zn-dependent protease with MMP-like domain